MDPSYFCQSSTPRPAYYIIIAFSDDLSSILSLQQEVFGFRFDPRLGEFHCGFSFSPGFLGSSHNPKNVHVRHAGFCIHADSSHICRDFTSRALNGVKAAMPVKQSAVIYWCADVIPQFLVSGADFLIEAH